MYLYLPEDYVYWKSDQFVGFLLDGRKETSNQKNVKLHQDIRVDHRTHILSNGVDEWSGLYSIYSMSELSL